MWCRPFRVAPLTFTKSWLGRYGSNVIKCLCNFMVCGECQRHANDLNQATSERYDRRVRYQQVANRCARTCFNLLSFQSKLFFSHASTSHQCLLVQSLDVNLRALKAFISITGTYRSILSIQSLTPLALVFRVKPLSWVLTIAQRQRLHVCHVICHKDKKLFLKPIVDCL